MINDDETDMYEGTGPRSHREQPGVGTAALSSLNRESAPPRLSRTVAHINDPPEYLIPALQRDPFGSELTWLTQELSREAEALPPDHSRHQSFKAALHRLSPTSSQG